ncbi:MAG: hypothetical protein H7839_11635 [Magnetococcus sp. YQC-5]
MSLTITLSDHATKIVTNHLPEYDSAETFAETAISIPDDQEQDDPKYIEYLRQALAEGKKGPMKVWDPENFKQKCMEKFIQGRSCHI